jgi:hypothetical protein
MDRNRLIKISDCARTDSSWEDHYLGLTWRSILVRNTENQSTLVIVLSKDGSA